MGRNAGREKTEISRRLTGINASIVDLAEDYDLVMTELRGIRKDMRRTMTANNGKQRTTTDKDAVTCAECRFSASLAETNTEEAVACMSPHVRNRIFGEVAGIAADFGCRFGERKCHEL